MLNLTPYGRTNNMMQYFGDLERSFFGDFFSGVGQIRTDIVDSGDRYTLSAELPGFSKEDIKIDLQDNTLLISAQRDEKIEENRDNFVRRERRCGSFSRSFDMTGIKTDAIRASYDNGVLNLELPKAEPDPVPPSRQIEIQS